MFVLELDNDWTHAFDLDFFRSRWDIQWPSWESVQPRMDQVDTYGEKADQQCRVGKPGPEDDALYHYYLRKSAFLFEFYSRSTTTTTTTTTTKFPFPWPWPPIFPFHSGVAGRLQSRLAADPSAVHRAGAAAGVKLTPEHQRHLQALREHPNITAEGPTEDQALAHIVRGMTPHVASANFYQDLAEDFKSQFKQILRSGTFAGEVMTNFQSIMGPVVEGANMTNPALAVTTVLSIVPTGFRHVLAYHGVVHLGFAVKFYVSVGTVVNQLLGKYSCSYAVPTAPPPHIV